MDSTIELLKVALGPLAGGGFAVWAVLYWRKSERDMRDELRTENQSLRKRNANLRHENRTLEEDNDRLRAKLRERS